MNANRKFQKVLDYYVERGVQYGKDIVAWYDTPEGQRSLSRSVSGSWGVERDPVRQAHGKIGEIATALYFMLDPLRIVKLNVGDGGDGGKDLRLNNGLRLDVKTTMPPFKLIWSMAINHLYLEKQFDVLVSVSIDELNFSNCWIEGWITKQDFYDKKEISNGINSNLTIGTWFMPKVVLSDMDILLRQHIPHPIVVCAQCGGGEWTDPPTDAPTVQFAGRLFHEQCVRFYK